MLISMFLTNAGLGDWKKNIFTFFLAEQLTLTLLTLYITSMSQLRKLLSTFHWSGWFGISLRKTKYYHRSDRRREITAQEEKCNDIAIAIPEW